MEAPRWALAHLACCPELLKGLSRQLRPQAGARGCSRRWFLWEAPNSAQRVRHVRTPHALRTRRRTAAAARSTARCSPQAPLRSALRSSKPEGGVQPGSSCQSPSAYAPHCSGRLGSPSSRCSCQRSGRPAGRSPAGGAARSPPSPPLAAISRPQGGPTPPRSPRAHLPTRGAPPPWGSRPSRPAATEEEEAGRGAAPPQSELRRREGSGSRWPRAAAATGGARRCATARRCLCGCVLLTRSPKQPACTQTARLGTAAGQTRSPAERRRSL